VSSAWKIRCKGEIVFVGGGNLIPLYPAIKTAMERFAGRAARLILLPHTVGGHRDLLAALDSTAVIFCREARSYDYVRAANSKSSVILAHDMAFHLDARTLLSSSRLASLAEPHFERFLRSRGWTSDTLAQAHGLRLHRTDAESDGRSAQKDVDISVEFQFGVDPSASRVATWCFLKAISLPQAIVTDRLHVAIATALLGKPCRLQDNSYGKNRAVYEHSIRGHFPRVVFE
jgi:exopolysaccharide biosynthesis predicted pyruvyltransferase EpsI